MSKSIAPRSAQAVPAFAAGQTMLNKVPMITLYFWIIKIMATTVGETAADFLNFNMKWGLTNTTYVMTVLLAVALVVQFRLRKYVPAAYWLVVVMISILGTLITDNLVDQFGVPLQTTTLAFAIALAVTFVAWYAVEKSLSIHFIHSTRREAFYWLAILFTFALGTAAGDLVSEGYSWGYLLSELIFAALIGVVAIAHYGFKLNTVAAFWIAYILTRPFGASMGDYLSQPKSNGGLALGTVGTSAIFLVVILGLVTYLARTKMDVPPPVELEGKME